MRTIPHKFVSILSISVAAFALYSLPVKAAGFYIQEQSVSGLGAAFSGSTTNLNDPSTMYFNPAGMTKLQGTQVQAGVHLLVPSSELTDTGSTQNALIGGGGAIGGNDGGNPYDPTPVPNGFVTHQINDRLWAGIGVTAPFGLANKYDDNWFGRYDSLKTELTVLDIQPTVAFKFNDELSLGAGINIQYADAELTNAASDTAEGVGTLKGDDWSLGFTLGAQFTPTNSTTIGASYHSAVGHELEGRTSVTGTSFNNFDVKGHAALDLPDIAKFGVKQDINDRWRVMGQATWFGWNNFHEIKTVVNESFSTVGGNSRAAGALLSNTVQNYQTTWAFAVGAEYDYSDDWTFRSGMQFDETPTTDLYRTSRTPDGDRTWLSGGATYNINDQWALDMAATYIWIEDEDINVTRNNTFSTVTATTVSAETEGNVGIVALGLTYKF